MSRKSKSSKAKRHGIGTYLMLIVVCALVVVSISPLNLSNRSPAIVETPAAVAPTPGVDPAEPVATESVPASTPAPTPKPVASGALVLPNGTEVTSDQHSVSLASVTPSDAAALASALPAHSEIKMINLGDCSNALSLSDIADLHESAPDVRIAGTIGIMGTPVSTRATSLDLSGLSHDDVASVVRVLPILSNLNYINLGDADVSPSITWEDMDAIKAAAPNAIVDFDFSFYDRRCSTADGVLNLSHTYIDDAGESVGFILQHMYNCKYVDMDSCGVSNNDMARLRDDFSNMKVVWRINFGNNYSVRTDVTRILASKPSVGGMLTADKLECLNYCQDVMYLDLGHNDDLDSISFVASMPRLEVLIVAMNMFHDLSPLEACPRLEFIEFQSTQVSDISPLAGHTYLKHVNMCVLERGVGDLSPLYDLTQLERVWIGCRTPVNDEQVQTLRDCLPDTVIDTEAYDPHDNQWRQISWDMETAIITYAPRYVRLRDQFGYNMTAYSFDYNDPKY